MKSGKHSKTMSSDCQSTYCTSVLLLTMLLECPHPHWSSRVHYICNDVQYHIFEHLSTFDSCCSCGNLMLWPNTILLILWDGMPTRHYTSLERSPKEVVTPKTYTLAILKLSIVYFSDTLLPGFLLSLDHQYILKISHPNLLLKNSLLIFSSLAFSHLYIPPASSYEIFIYQTSLDLVYFISAFGPSRISDLFHYGHFFSPSSMLKPEDQKYTYYSSQIC